MAEDLRLAEFWPAVKTRLDVTAMQAATGAAGRVYLATENIPVVPAGAVEAGPWGRVVIQPSRIPGFIAGDPLRLVRFLVVAQVKAFRGTGYDPAVPLDKMIAVATDRLQWWAPTGFSFLQVGMAVTLETPSAAMPMYEAETDCYWTSAGYRFEAAPAA